jgi:hypothetical protein
MFGLIVGLGGVLESRVRQRLEILRKKMSSGLKRLE